MDKLDYMRVSMIHEEAYYTHKIQLDNFRGAWTAINRELVFRLFEAYSKMQRLKKVLSSDALKLSSENAEEVKKIPQNNKTASPCSPFVERQHRGRESMSE